MDDDLNIEELFALADQLADDDFIDTTKNNQSNRYAAFSKSEEDEFINLQRKKNTVKNTNTSVNQFIEFVKFASPLETRPLEEISAPELDDYLSSFFLGTRQKSGSEYEPDTLTNYQKGIDRYLQQRNYGLSICRDKEFKRSREILAAKRSELKKMGKGNTPQPRH